MWDAGGFVVQRMFWDTAAVLDPAAGAGRAENYFRPLTRPGELAAAWTRQGLQDVRETTLAMRMEYRDFEDYWWAIGAGEGSMGKSVAHLGVGMLGRERFGDGLEDRYAVARADHGELVGAARESRTKAQVGAAKVRASFMGSSEVGGELAPFEASCA